MADIEVKGKINIDADAALKQTLLLKDNIKELSKEFKSAKAGSDEQVAALKKLEAAQKELDNSTKGTQTTFGKLREGLSAQIPAFKGASDGADGLKKKFLELMANPIVLIFSAIVLVLKFLYESFTNTSEGAKKMDQIMAGLKATLGVLMDTVFALGRAWIDAAKALFSVYEAAYKFITLDFKGASQAIDEAKQHAKDAVADVKEAGDKFADAASGRTATTVANATAALQKIAKAEREDEVDKAKRAKDLALLREKLNDETVPLAEKRKAAMQLRDEEKKNAEDDYNRQVEKVKQKKILLTVDKDGAKKNAQEIADLDKSIYETQKENALEGVRTNKVIKNLEKQANAEAAAESKTADEKKKEEKQRLHEYLNRLEKINQENQLATIRDGYAKEKQVIENKIADDARAIETSYKDGKLKLVEYQNLLAALKIQADNQRKQLDDKHNKEVQANEANFKDKLAAIQRDTSLASIEDLRAREMEQLEAGYVDKRAAIEKDEKLTAEQKIVLTDALLTQERLHLKQLNEKFEKEDAKQIADLKKGLSDGQMTPEQKELATLEETFAKKRQIAKGNNDLLLQVEAEYIRQKEAIGEAHAQQELDIVGGMANNIAGLLGKSTAAGKAAAVAGATIDTYSAAWKAFSNAQKNPISILGPAYPYISAGLAVAGGLANIKNILSVPTPGGSSSSPSGVNIASPVAPTQASTKLDSASIQGVGNAAGAGVGRSFVLESDISNNAERAAMLNRAARLG